MVRREKVMVVKSLVAFDFDHTIVDHDSCMRVIDLSPGALPDHITSLYNEEYWIDYMSAIFKHLHDNNVTAEQMKDYLCCVPLVQGMKELVSHLKEANGDQFDIIIVSDSNVLFIEWMLQHQGMLQYIDVIYSNPALIDHNGRVHLQYFHTQDWCELSPMNLCKGHILEQHIQESSTRGVEYSRVLYIGDGFNDYCPSLRLSSNDVVFPRKSFKLSDAINEQGNIQAKVVPWSDGLQIKEFISRL